MAEENKHPPTTEEQAPPEMPGKAPEMEQAEIPDVGGAPAPSAKVIDLSAVRSAPEKDAPPDIPKEPEAPPVSVTEYSKQEWEKPFSQLETVCRLTKSACASCSCVMPFSRRACRIFSPRFCVMDSSLASDAPSR